MTIENINNNFKKVVVTGASGYIASTIIKDLLLDGSIEKVVAIVRDKNNTLKYKFLTDLDGASEKLELESGDLETANYQEIFNGTDGIIHVASPYLYKAEDPDKEIVQPAIQGNLRVLDAASKYPSIKKVIITSSIVAITDFSKKKAIYNEDDWNDSSNISTPYPYSKYLAEKATWNYKETHPDAHFEIIIINPAFVLGPAVKGYPSLNTSLTTFRNALLGQGEPYLINRLIGLIDVRDVSRAHINALKSSNLNSTFPIRYLMANEILTTFQMTDLAKDIFKNKYDIKSCESDQDIVKLNHQYKLQSKSPFKLNQYIDINTTIKDCVNFLIESNHFTPTINIK